MSRFVKPFQSAYDLNGKPLDGAKLHFFETGTSTPKDTYSDVALTTPNANPVIANNEGAFGPIFLKGSYRVRLDDKNDVTQSNYPAELTDTSIGSIGNGLELVNNTLQFKNDFTVTHNLNDMISKFPVTDFRAALPTGFVTDGSVDYSSQMTQLLIDLVNGGRILFPTGTWSFGAITVTDNISLVGLGWESILKPLASVTGSFIKTQNQNVLKDFKIDGSITTDVQAILVGSEALNNLGWINGLRINSFSGPLGVGIKIENMVTLRVQNTLGINCEIGTLLKAPSISGPTTISYDDCQFRGSGKDGAVIERGSGIQFNQCIFEANDEHGARIQPALGTESCLNISFNDCHFEDNQNNDNTKYHVTIDGTLGNVTARIRMIGSTFSGTAGQERSIFLKDVQDFHEEGSSFTIPFANQIVAEGDTNTGKIETTQAPDTNVNINSGVGRTLVEVGAGEWITWTPTATPSGSMTYTSVIFREMRYKVRGKIMYLSMSFDGTVGGTPDTTITISLPPSTTLKVAASILFTPCVIRNANIEAGHIVFNPTTGFNFTVNGGGNFTAGTLRGGSWTGVVEID